MDQFAWSKSDALYNMGLTMCAGALVACVTFVCIGPLCRWFAEQNVLLWGGILPMVLGRLLYIPWGDQPPAMATFRNVSSGGTAASAGQFHLELVGCPETQTWCHWTPALTLTQFLLGFFMTSVGYPIGLTLIQTIFSKLLGPRPQGVWMSMITGAGCLSRIMGSVCVTFVYTRFGTYATFGGTAVMMMVALVWIWWFRQRFVVAELETMRKPTDVEMEVMSTATAVERELLNS